MGRDEPPPPRWPLAVISGLALVAIVAVVVAVVPPGCKSGGRIAFESDRDGNAEIHVMNADGSEQANLTNNPAPDWEPSWSPDGRRIAFTPDRDGNAEKIYVMNADGQRPDEPYEQPSR